MDEMDQKQPRTTPSRQAQHTTEHRHIESHSHTATRRRRCQFRSRAPALQLLAVLRAAVSSVQVCRCQFRSRAPALQLLAVPRAAVSFDSAAAVAGSLLSAAQGNDRVFVRVDNTPYSVNTLEDNYDDSNSIFADAPDDNDDEGGTSRPAGTAQLPERIRKEILELGFPDDGYNYLTHLREIKNNGGGSAFYENPKSRLYQLPHDIKAYDASRVNISEVKNENEKSIYSVASKSVNVKVQRAVDPEVAALLDDSDLSRFGSDVEDLEEDFILQANCTEEGINLGIDEKLNLSEEYKVVDEVSDAATDGYLILSNGHNAVQEGNRVLEEARDEGVTEKPRMRRLLDEKFDLLECQEYGTDSEDDYDGDIAEEDESLADKLKLVLDDRVTDELQIDDDYKVPAPDIIRRCVEYAEKYAKEKEDEEVAIVQESSDESEKWDCETIISTYSNLDNHPAKIVAPGLARKKKLAETISGALNAPNHVISLRGKEKLPVDFLPLRQKAATEKVKSAGAPKTEQQKRKQHGQESKEEKRERKAAVKEGRREARQAKKEMKELYRCEAQRAQKAAAISCPSSIRLIRSRQCDHAAGIKPHFKERLGQHNLCLST
ncbi:protein ltv1 [Citrus sinensis]|uniref:Protein ltv1 n=1 Tax=Citrus sinensis TaxID=2711 RepID=A0ACB8HRL0_CITSI|nr:protein ltv1 [Citrus sinensis]